ncbi:MAG: excinuclease ABC subunit UvrA [Chloroflexi bacterium]|uniref:UvrABC system protein A n=1 Tax=Candidatus Chlorohelix allophototropha TaxID=3003348 RepID=A0A8T7M5S3_9CHLR|nr:excinuclease ABC subunit UvrA [Chloroflexota bacterium]WJW69379.1 excinuclease ABC subunit UvrA [Chloroflexota bacterium L227-S17]
MEPENIVIKGAEQHNLKKIDVKIPRNKLVVLTGVSGSGKSSLAFDTIYAEGQRRYVESLSSYARQFLGQMEKPKVDFIGGLSPAIAIEQKTVSKNPRSTVGTVTEVLDYLRVLYARIGTAHCPDCGRVVQAQTAQQIADQLANLPSGTRLQLLAPIVRERKGTHAELLEQARKDGFVRARIDGKILDLSGEIKLAKTKKHNIELVIDRLKVPDEEGEVRQDFEKRLADSVSTTLQAGDGLLVADLGEGKDLILSEQNACPNCSTSFPELSPQLFSFNSPLGMCPDCHGLGTKMSVDPNLIVSRPDLSLMDGASRWYGELRKKKEGWTFKQLKTLAEYYEVDLETPWKDLPEKFRHIVLYGSGDDKIKFSYENRTADSTWTGESLRVTKGIVYHAERLFRQTSSEYTQRFYASFMSEQPCDGCGGARLRAEARGVKVGGISLTEIGSMTIANALEWVKGLYRQLDPEQFQIAGEVLKEIRERLQFMLNVGLYYLTLDRPAPSLSGGEGQRIRLASQLGCGLVGVLYILDEPSIGLHPRDNRALLDTLLQLRDMGNTVLVVEHDEDTMMSADWLIDMGPRAGVLGGEVVSAGLPRQVADDPLSLTGRYLRGDLVVSASNESRRTPNGKYLSLVNARLHNLKNVTARFPLGLFTCVTGVSGSGKSSLISQTLYPALAHTLHRAEQRIGLHDRLEGLEHLDKVINITQEPIGRTPRSNPATYVGLFDDIRKTFAASPEARTHGYGADRFSFNVKGGRCEACKGHGLKRIEMHFLADMWVTCRECKGMRYNRETLSVRFKGKNIAQVLDMDVQEALEFFANIPSIARVLQTLHDVGLDYVKLGQSATTLSGGEAQRVKLASELCRVSTGRTVYILDEPTTGLHFADIQRLLDVLHRLVDAGNTVIVIEHNLDVIKTADWLIDLGPEGGEGGGEILAEGTPEQVTLVERSYTGKFLRQNFEKNLTPNLP